MLSPILTQCITHFGWQTAYLIKAGIFGALCLPALLYPFHFNPRDDGLLPYGYKEENSKQEAKTTKKVSYLSLGMVCFFVFSVSIAFVTGITQHLPGFAVFIGLSVTVGSLLLSAGMVGNIVSKILIGALSDKIGTLNATLVMLVANLIAVILFLTSTSSTVLIFATVLFGFCYAISAVGTALLTKYFFGQENYDQVFPKISFIGNLGAAISLSMIGYIYDIFGSYVYAFYFANAILVIGIYLLLITDKKQAQN